MMMFKWVCTGISVAGACICSACAMYWAKNLKSIFAMKKEVANLKICRMCLLNDECSRNCKDCSLGLEN